MRVRLLWKLLAINVPIVAAVILVVWMVIDYLAADYFTTLMERYNIDPVETHQMFLDAVHRYLIQASVVALVLAVGLSFLFTRRALRPLAEMADVTRRLSEGDYAARVVVRSTDEVGELGHAVNRMADSLERIEALRKKMVGDITHELRTPLTNIRGYLEGLSDGVIAPSPETFGMLQQEIFRLVRLVDDVHRLTRAEAGTAYLRRETLDLAELLRQVVDLDREQFERRGIQIRIDVDPEAGCVAGDRDKLLQIFHNITQNAWQYTPEGGTFRISAKRGDGSLVLAFANSGEIAERDLTLVFERFYRAEQSRFRGSGGAGIGLAIVKELVEAHGGAVGAESRDGETRFTITLPA